MQTFLLILFSICLTSIAQSQSESCFCDAVEKSNFKKVERLFRKQVSIRKHGISYDNGPGSGMQVTHVPNIDTLTLWLRNKPCVDDAFRDKCQIKPAIYPGWSIIGVKFKTSQGIVEKCFNLQEGTMGTVHIFGWKPHIFKMKQLLVYKRIADCEGFMEQQKKNCQETNQKE